MISARSGTVTLAWRKWIAGAGLFLAGCAGTPAVSGSACEGPTSLDLAPASLGYSLSLSQVVTGEYGGDSHSMRFEVEITPKRVVMVGLSHVGVRLFTLKQDAAGLRVESLAAKGAGNGAGNGAGRPARMGGAIEPCYILSDLQLTYWPEGVLRQALLLKGLRITGDGKGPGPRRRIFGPDGALLIEITYPVAPGNAGETVVQRYNPPYRLRIKTLQKRVWP